MTKDCKDLLDNPRAKKLFSEKVFDPPKGYRDFIVASKTFEDQVIDLRTIIGSTIRHKHEDTWLKTLRYLNRRVSNFDNFSCTEIIEFYINPDYKRKQRSYAWHIVFINEDGFISEGHHRTTIAKFLSTLEHIDHCITIPKVTYYDVDIKSLKKFNRLNKKLSLLKKILCKDLYYSIKVQNDNYNISYYLSINIRENRLVDHLYDKKFDSLEELKTNLFQYLRNYLNQVKINEEKERREKIFTYILVAIVAGAVIVPKFL